MASSVSIHVALSEGVTMEPAIMKGSSEAADNL